MGKCNIDHSLEDVRQKFQSQKEFLPEDLKVKVKEFLVREHTQDILNNLFHLLKKYDLALEEERKNRNKKLLELIQA